MKRLAIYLSKQKRCYFLGNSNGLPKCWNWYVGSSQIWWWKILRNSSKEGEWPLQCALFGKAIGYQYSTVKERNELSFFYKNVYRTDINPRLTKIDENGKSIRQWLWTYWQFFFPFTKRLFIHDTYQVVGILFCSYFIEDMF